MTLSRFKLSADTAVPVEEPRDEERPSKLPRNLLMAGAAALPFAGLIGEKPRIHEGKGQEFRTLADLQKAVRPGDVVLSSPHKKSFTNLGIGLGTGVPDVSHAAFVDNEGRMVTIRDEKPVVGPMVDTWQRGRAYTVLRPKAGGPLNPDELALKYRRHLDLANKLEAQAAARGASRAEIDAMRREFYTKTPGFIRTPLHSVMAPTIGPTAGDEAKTRFESFLKKPNTKNLHECAGGWCALPGSMAFPKGVDVVKGRKPGDTTPVDFLRSEHLEAVGGYGRNKKNLVNKLIKAGPTAARLTYGALGAGGVYLADKAIDALRRRHAEKAPPQEQVELPAR